MFLAYCEDNFFNCSANASPQPVAVPQFSSLANLKHFSGQVEFAFVKSIIHVKVFREF